MDTREIYPAKDFLVEFDKQHLQPIGADFIVEYFEDGFRLRPEITGDQIFCYNYQGSQTTFAVHNLDWWGGRIDEVYGFGQWITSDFCRFRLVPTSDSLLHNRDTDNRPIFAFRTYEDVASAKAAIDKYDGVDMGLGTTLELQAL